MRELNSEELGHVQGAGLICYVPICCKPIVICPPVVVCPETPPQKKGNPGNHKQVGNAGENPNGKGGWNYPPGVRGRSD